MELEMERTGEEEDEDQEEADDCHATVGGHGLEFYYFEVSATTLGRKK